MQIQSCFNSLLRHALSLIATGCNTKTIQNDVSVIFGYFLELRFSDAIQPFRRTQQLLARNQCGGCHPHVVFFQSVRVQHFEFVTFLYHISDAILVQTEDFVTDGPRRRSEGSAVGQTLLGVNFATSRSVVTSEQSSIIKDIQPAMVHQRGRIVWPSLWL